MTTTKEDESFKGAGGKFELTKEKALRRLQQAQSVPSANSVWYSSGADISLYIKAKKSCQVSKEKVLGWGLSKDEEGLLRNAPSIEDVIEQIGSVQSVVKAQQKKSKAAKATADFMNAFCEFAMRFSNIVKILLPQSPEYAISYGLLALLFKAVIDKKEKEESITAFIVELSKNLPVLDFYQNVFPTSAMKTTIAELYVEVNETVTYAVSYYRTSRFGKLMDVLLETRDDRFTQCQENISSLVTRLNFLKDAAHVAQQADIQEVVEASGAVIARLYENYELSTAALSASIVFLNEQVQSLQRSSQDMANFHSSLHANNLISILLPTIPPATDLLAQSLARTSHMSPKDRWENNGVLTHLESWSSLTRPNLLWLAGQSGNQDTWVTDFSQDLIAALQSQDVLLLFAMCRTGLIVDEADEEDEGSTESDGVERITPVILVKMLIAQILERRPWLVTKLWGVLNENTVRRVKTLEKAWGLLQELLREVDERVLLLIDRVDQCINDSRSTIDTDLLPKFVELAEHEEQVDVIVTSVFIAPENLLESRRISHVWIGTARRTFMA